MIDGDAFLDLEEVVSVFVEGSLRVEELNLGADWGVVLGGSLVFVLQTSDLLLHIIN